MELLIVTGMSGAGKSQVVDVLEDIGYYCVDNVPPSLIVRFADLPRERGRIERIALVVDVRSRDMFEDLAICLEELGRTGIAFRILFLDCSDDVLATRYKETRRRHPLLDDLSSSTRTGVAEERRILADIRARADYLVDTSLLSAAQLRMRVREMFAHDARHTMVINCMSFGFKYGLPGDSDLVFDLRCLPNPFYVPELRPLTGLDKPVADFLTDQPPVLILRDKLFDMLDFLAPLYIAEGKSQLVVSVGCTGGKHRSVAFAYWLAEHLRAQGRIANCIHRDIEKG